MLIHSFVNSCHHTISIVLFQLEKMTSKNVLRFANSVQQNSTVCKTMLFGLVCKFQTQNSCFETPNSESAAQLQGAVSVMVMVMDTVMVSVMVVAKVLVVMLLFLTKRTKRAKSPGPLTNMGSIQKLVIFVLSSMNF